MRKVQLRLTFRRLVSLLLLHVGAQYSAGAYTSARAEVQSVDGLPPHPVPTSLWMSALRAMTLSLESCKILTVGEYPAKRDAKVSGFG